MSVIDIKDAVDYIPCKEPGCTNDRAWTHGIYGGLFREHAKVRKETTPRVIPVRNHSPHSLGKLARQLPAIADRIDRAKHKHSATYEDLQSALSEFREVLADIQRELG